MFFAAEDDSTSLLIRSLQSLIVTQNKVPSMVLIFLKKEKKKKGKTQWLQCTEKCDFVLYHGIGRNKWACFLLTLILWFCNSFNFNAFYVRLNLMYMYHAYTCSSKRHFVTFIVSVYIKYIEGKEKHSDRTSWCLQLKHIGHSWFGLSPSTSHVTACLFGIGSIQQK